MPGVPSSRGCNACRKQKKKCDQLNPSCSRCTRLKIDCEGSGQLRYRFKHHNVDLASTKTQEAQPPPITAEIVPSPITSIDNTLALSGFLSALKVTDLRYDVTYYGGFIAHIPRRMGKNDALDASVSALATAFPSVYSGQQPPEMLEKYGYALKTLRTTLLDPTKVYTPETLCAIYLLGVCQSWLGRSDDQLSSHGEIMSHFLNNAPLEDWHENFEKEMLVTICAALVLESLVNPKIQLTAFFSKLQSTFGKTFGPRRNPDSGDIGPIDSIKLQNIARLGDILRDPELHVVEFISIYQQLRVDFEKIRLHLTLFEESTAIIRNPLESHFKAKAHIAYQAACGMICTMALITSCILRIFYPDYSGLDEDTDKFAAEIMQLAENASQYRPMGAGYMPFCLMVAWVALDGTPKHAEVDVVLQDWISDFKSLKWMTMAMWLKTKLEDLRLKVSVSRLDVSSDSS